MKINFKEWLGFFRAISTPIVVFALILAYISLSAYNYTHPAEKDCGLFSVKDSVAILKLNDNGYNSAQCKNGTIITYNFMCVKYQNSELLPQNRTPECEYYNWVKK